jgi:dTDP-glucose pyrophosphorylase
MIPPDMPVIRVMEVINATSLQIALVVDADFRLLGTITDGDVRRAILRGTELSAPAYSVMNDRPLTLAEGESHLTAVALMRERAIHQLPVVNSERRVVGLITLDTALREMREETTVVLMAGGRGSRLMPLTESTPKPLLPIGGRPLLEITISSLARQGFGRFLVSINYKAEMFRHHFAEGKHLGVEIGYLQEEERLGTAGALRLLSERPNSPVLVMNADILTNLDARQLLSFHRAQGVCATMCVREHEWRVPYGVVQVADDRLMFFEEKPVRKEFVNAGIYVLSPEALDHMPRAGSVDMPHLFRTIAEKMGPQAVYLLREYWLDIGQFEDLQRAQDDVHLFQ